MYSLVDLVLFIQEQEKGELRIFKNFINHYGTYERCGSLIHLEQMTEILRSFFLKLNEEEIDNLIQEVFQRFSSKESFFLFLFTEHLWRTRGKDKEKNHALRLRIYGKLGSYKRGGKSKMDKIIKKLGDLAGEIFESDLGSVLAEINSIDLIFVREALETSIKNAVKEGKFSYEDLVEKLNSRSPLNFTDESILEGEKQREIESLQRIIKFLEEKGRSKDSIKGKQEYLNNLRSMSMEEWKKKMEYTKEAANYESRWLLSFLLDEEEKEKLRKELVNWWISTHPEESEENKEITRSLKGDDILISLFGY